MIKSLRTTLLAVLALASAATQAKTVVFDFNANGLTMFDGITAVSTTSSNDGDFTTDKSTTVDGVTLTVSTSTSPNTQNRLWKDTKSGTQLRIYGGTLTLAASEKITKVEFSKGSKFTTDAVTTTPDGTFNDATWTPTTAGNNVVFTLTPANKKQLQINSITVTLGEDENPGGGTTPEVTKAENISAFIALAENTEAQLTLTNAKVLYTWTSNNGNNSTFVKDATGTVLFYNTGLTLAAGDDVNGSVILKRSAYNDMVQATKADGTKADNLTIVAGSAPVATEITPAQAAQNVANLVVLKNVKVVEDNSKYYAVSGTDSVQLYNGFHLDDANIKALDNATVTGIVEQYKTTYEVYPTVPVEATVTGINAVSSEENTLNAVRYNVAGQRVSSNYKGVVIMNGKKYLNK